MRLKTPPYRAVLAGTAILALASCTDSKSGTDKSEAALLKAGDMSLLMPRSLSCDRPDKSLKLVIT